MALLTAGLVAAVGAVAGVSGITAVVITNNRHTIIINQTDKAIQVTVDGEEMKISAKMEWDFKVKQASPIRIRVRWDNNDGNEKGGNEGAKVDDNAHRDFIVKVDPEGKLELVWAQKYDGKWLPRVLK